MKRFLLSSVFLLSLIFSIHGVQAAILMVQTGVGSDDGSNNTVTASWGNPTVAGNLLAAIIGFKGGPSVVITPPPGLGWSEAIRSNDADISTAIYYIANAPSQSSSAWTLSSAQPVTLTLIEYSGAAAVNPLDTMSLATSTSTGTFTLGDSGTTPLTSYPTEVAVAGITVASGNTNFSAQTNGFIDRGQLSPAISPMAPGIRTVFEEKFLFSADTPNVQTTINGIYATPTWAWAGAIATFRAEAEPAQGTDLCANIPGTQSTVPSGYTMNAATGECTASSTVVDLCTNLTGDQTTVPSGYTMNAATGECTASSTVVDLCTNLTGDQTTVPSGYTMNAATGECTASSTVVDLCTNLTGDQTTVPSGYTMNAATGECTASSTVVDLCTNLTGDQTTVPSGYVMNAAGDCVQDTGGTSGGDAGGPGGMAPFTDITNSWSTDYIQELYKMGVVSGLTPTTFGPGEKLTRGQMAKIAMLLFGFQIPEITRNPFIDVSASAWFGKYVSAAAMAGIVGGYPNKTFMPDNNILRVEALKVLLEAAAKANNSPSDIFDRWGNVSFFPDVDKTDWYAKYVSFAFANGIVSGKSALMFAPGDNVTREEMSKMSILTQTKFREGLAVTNPSMIQQGAFDCTGTVPVSGNTCKQLVIHKQVPGHSAQVFDFYLDYIGASTPYHFQLDDDGNNANAHSNTITLNVYSNFYYFLSENPVSGFSTTVMNDNSGSSVPIFTGSGPNSSIPLYRLDPTGTPGQARSYTVVNTAVSLPIDYDAFGKPMPMSGVLDGSIETPTDPAQFSTASELIKYCATKAGDPNKCGHLVIVKDTGAMSAQVFNFNGSVGAFTLDNDGGSMAPYSSIPKSRIFNVNPGTYTVNEVAASGYTLTSVTCVSSKPGQLSTVTYTSDPVTGSLTGFTVPVPAGETITCTFTNTGLGSSGTGDTGLTGNVGQNLGMRGTVVGPGGEILYSADAGLTWTTKVSGVTNALEAVSFFDHNTGLAVGDFGAMTKSTDGGQTWSPQTSGTTKDLYAVSFSTTTTVTAVGSTGAIIRSANGGVTWTAQASGTTNHLRGVSFVGANTGVAVGDGGTVLRTTNGGTTWTTQTSGTTVTLYAVSMSSASVGLAVGGSSAGGPLILRTVNGGVTWTAQTIPAAASGPTFVLLALSFDGTNGTAVGSTELILTTGDGGTTWTKQPYAPGASVFGPQTFRGVSHYKPPYANSVIGVIIGVHNETARTVNGGSVWVDRVNPFTGENTPFYGVDMH